MWNTSKLQSTTLRSHIRSYTHQPLYKSHLLKYRLSQSYWWQVWKQQACGCLLKNSLFCSHSPLQGFGVIHKGIISRAKTNVVKVRDQRRIANQVPRVQDGGRLTQCTSWKSFWPPQWWEFRLCAVVSLTVIPLWLTWRVANQNDPGDCHADTSTHRPSEQAETQPVGISFAAVPQVASKKKKKQKLFSFFHTAAFSFRKKCRMEV